MRCLQCGKEIPEGRKFCSSSCSAKYNNVRRERKPWTEEQKENVRGLKVKQVCKYCNQLTGKITIPSKQAGVCSCCKPFVQRIVTFDKLGLKTGTLQDRLEQTQKIICSRYFDEKESIPSLREELGIDTVVLYRIIQADPRGCRSQKESQLVAFEKGRKEINDSLLFQSGTHLSWEGFKFHYRSSWERRYMEELDSKQIRYEYEPFYIRYFDTQQQKERLAKPDFYFPDTAEIVELKSSFTYNEQNMKDRFKAYREKGYNPRLLLDWKFVDI